MQEAEVVALPRIILKRWPEAGIDVLINNAGLARDNAALCSGSTASWVEMISTNVLGLCMCTREAVQARLLIYTMACLMFGNLFPHVLVLHACCVAAKFIVL